MTTFHKAAHTTKWIPVKDLSVIWAQAQRPLNVNHAQKIADNLDPDMFGSLAVTLPNGAGVYHVIDGNHRRWAVESLYGPNEQVPCNIFDAADPARAAEIFDQINTSRKSPEAIDTFRVRVTAGRVDEVAVNDIVEGFGYQITATKRHGTISAVRALLGVYRSYGSKTLHDALSIIQATFGKDPDSVKGPLISGYGKFISEYGADANWQRLIEKVQKDHTPNRLLANAKAAREVNHSNLTDGVKYVLVATYNSGLRSGRLDD